MFPQQNRTLPPGKKIYFASDFHLGLDGKYTSAEREKKIVTWLEDIRIDAAMIFLVGDIFDYWFEYARVIPKGFTRLLGKIAELNDQGIEIIYYTGNHDMWVFSYFQTELGISVFKSPVEWRIGEKVFLIGHGDGLGPGDYGYKIIKKIFNNPLCQWLFERIHPNTGIRLMQYFSQKSRLQNQVEAWNEDKEWLVKFCKERAENHPVDFFIFGHRHLVIDYLLPNKHTRYINLGDWYRFFSFAIFDGKDMTIHFLKEHETPVIKNYAP